MLATNIKTNRKYKNSSGQMTVELAVCIPVVFVVMAIAYNLLIFMGYCASFDRLVEENTAQLAISPATDSYAAGAAAQSVQRELRQEIVDDPNKLEVTVKTEAAWAQNLSDGALQLIFPTEKLIAKLSFKSMFFGANIFGFTVPALTHEKSVVYSPYRAGVVV